MSQLCPYCGFDMYELGSDGSWPNSAVIDVWEGETEHSLPCVCTNCGKPIVATAKVTLFQWRLEIEPDGEEAKKELELYEKRMRGDWS